METEKKTHGGRRQGAGRKKTVAKRCSFNAPADVAAILDGVKGSLSDFINAAIRTYAQDQAKAIDQEQAGN